MSDESWAAAIAQWKHSAHCVQKDYEKEKYEEIAKLLLSISNLTLDSTSRDVPNCRSSYTPLSSVSTLSQVSNEGVLDVEDVLKRELFLNKPPPPRGYVCDICWMGGHYKNMCPNLSNRVNGVTPYQGTKQCFGEFKCSKCKRKWTSYHSWANFAQKCVKCNIEVYPKKQRPLTDFSTNVNKHPRHLCEKCGLLGDILCSESCGGKNENMSSILRSIHRKTNSEDIPAKKHIPEWKLVNGPVRTIHKNHVCKSSKNEKLELKHDPNFKQNVANTKEFVNTSTTAISSFLKPSEGVAQINKTNKCYDKNIEAFANTDYFKALIMM